MPDLVFSVSNREKKEKAKNLIKREKIPAVVYGPGRENMDIMLDKSDVLKHLNRIAETTPITLKLDGNEMHGFLKGAQRDKITDNIIHLDFYISSEGHKMEIHIPLTFVGEPAGIEHGGIVQEIITDLPVQTLPKDIVETIEVNVEELEIGDVIRVKDLDLPEGIKPLIDEDRAVYVVESPRSMTIEEEEELLAEAEEEEEMEAEVIEKGKEEEEIPEGEEEKE
ncbi:MAG: 50S ribosomal protein L25 [Thermotogota bacterium]|nr:50S ribosomal protein L25 [Thermotogota bacterium]